MEARDPSHSDPSRSEAKRTGPDQPDPVSDPSGARGSGGAAGSRPNAGTTVWLRGSGHLSDVVLSSRVRLARNLSGFPFPPGAEAPERAQILEICRRCLDTIGEIDGSSMRWIDLRRSPALERRLLVERQIMSRQHELGRCANGRGGPDSPRGLGVYEPDERISVLVNEEDHLRIQVLRSGLDLASCLREANAIDDKIERIVDYAFHPRFGYLTACPTNVGTGLRLSVMVHLPALKITGELEKVRNAANDMGLAVRGIYGEGSDAAGGLFQISNQVTLGKSDEMLLREIEGQVVPMIVRYEHHARRTLVREHRATLEDRVFRARGVLSSARLMKTDEALQLLDDLRLGVLCGLIEDIPLTTVHALVLMVQPGHLRAALGRELDQAQRREARATLLRERIGGACA